MDARRTWIGYAWAAATAAACTAIGLALDPQFDLVNIAMVYLLAVVLVALYQSRGGAIAASVLCVAAFDVSMRGLRRQAGSTRSLETVIVRPSTTTSATSAVPRKSGSRTSASTCSRSSTM